MAAPRKMTAHTLEAPKGWPSPHAVDFQAKLSANVTIDPVFAGRVVHLNADGEFEMGVSGTQMAMFLFQNSDDPDVKNDGGDPETEVDVWVAIAPTGKINALVAAGAYELASTEYLSADEASLVPNAVLTAGTSNSVSGTGGVLALATLGTHNICGVVSRGVKTNSHLKKEVYFWPVWFPAGIDLTD